MAQGLVRAGKSIKGGGGIYITLHIPVVLSKVDRDMTVAFGSARHGAGEANDHSQIYTHVRTNTPKTSASNS